MKRQYLKDHCAPGVADKVDELNDNVVATLYDECRRLAEDPILKPIHKGIPYITDIEIDGNATVAEVSGARVSIS